MDSYSFNQHRHNYATWTAARAVQRNFTTTSNIKHAIEQSGLPEFVDSNEDITITQFDTFHRQWAKKIDTAFKQKGVNDCTYGRAAKIIAIYLKTAIVLCNKGACSRSKLIHPPIDRILLNNILQKEKLADLKSVRWTQIKEKEYWELVDRLRQHFSQFDWKLEYYWTPELD